VQTPAKPAGKPAGNSRITTFWEAIIIYIRNISSGGINYICEGFLKDFIII
jgi:hypothetical protein